MTLVVRPSRFLHYNAGAFVSGGEACLVDPGLLRDEITGLAGEVAPSAIRFVVLTHADWDHVLGPEHLPSATVVAHDAYASELDPAGTRAALAGIEEHAGVVRSRSFEPPLPDVTFADELRLELGDLELHLLHMPGHTASMTSLYEPASRTLWAGDVLSDVEIPLVVHDLNAYERTLERLAALEIHTLVPGHGSPTSDEREVRTRLDDDRAYLAELRDAVMSQVAAGFSLAEAVAACSDVTLRRSPGDEDVHRLNVEKVYADLGGDADPADVGFARAWKAATGA